MKEYITLTVDGKSVKIEKGSTLLEAARKAGADIPTLCHDERVKPYGACGMCVVECKGSPKLMRSCAIEAADGMEIITESDRINRARRFSLEMLLSDHTGDCKAPCSLACPAGTDCQGYVGLIANGENAQALSVIKGRIPLPASIGRVCPHPCEKKCRRGLVEEPISIAALKAYAADRDLESGNIFMPEVAESTGKKVAIIGGGPGGISAAYYLAIKGHGVTVFDMMPKMGGMLRYGIPQYRLPKEVLDKELALVEKLGVEFRNNIKIGRDISLDTLNQEYDAVIAAPGAWSSTKMRVDGEDAEGVFGGIDFLRSVILGSPVDIGKRVAVCGGGNTAMDACRTAVRLGAEKVYIIYRRTRDEMPADALEIDEAQEEGVDFRFLTNPDKILTQDGKVCGIKLQIMELGEPDVSGRRKPVPIEGKFETLEVDSVIMAIGQKPELSGFEELDTTSRGTISADESTFRTNISGIFAIGDATNKGADIAISAIGEAQKSASVVDSYLRGNIIGYKKPILVEREINKSDLADREHIARERMRVLPAEERKHSFDEVALGLTDEQARREASRCLECGCLDYYRCKLINYANKYNAEFERFAGQKSPAKKDTGHKYILRDSGKCILCGLCVRVCSQVMGVGAIGLAGRGFTTVVSPEFYKSLGDSQCISCGQCVSLCPTGALVEKVPFKKNVPLREICTMTHCTGCAAKCAINVFSSGSSITRCEPANGNIICTYGKFGLSKLANVGRLKVCKSGEETISLERAAEIISEKTACFSPAEIAVTVCENMTDNELEKAGRVADFIDIAHLMALDALERVIEISILEITAKNLAATAPLSFIGAAKAAAQVAAIKAAFAVVKGLVGNFYTGGYTGSGSWDQPQGIVHSNEFVANRFAVANPNLRPIFDAIDVAQRSGNVANLTAEDIAAVAGPGKSTRTVPVKTPAASATTTTNDPAVVAMLIECTRTLRKLKTRLDEPLVAETYLTGKRGINQAQKEYQKLNNNKSRNKL